MHFVFWQNILSPHQAPFLRALADSGHAVTVLSAEVMTLDRVALGWKTPDMGRAEIVISPQRHQVRDVVNGSPKTAIHIMAGARWTDLGREALQACVEAKRRIGIMSEAPDPRGLGGYARWIKYALERFSNGSSYEFILAMGELGTRWFCHCGYPIDRVFPFAYVTEPGCRLPSVRPQSELSFLFAGQFIHRKGLDVLIRALALMQSRAFQMTLLGSGPQQKFLKILANQLGVESRLVWSAATDSSGVQGEMQKADVTVLPSRHDGWGAVINESLMVGTPVICSTACGGAVLIRHPWLGTVFRSGSVDELARALKFWINSGPRSEVQRERIRNWSTCITGESVAKYFVAIMEHIYANAQRPLAPWRAPLGSGDLRPLTSDA